MRRPFYFINSSMFVEDGSGNIIGEVQQRWHLWRRNYDLYIGGWLGGSLGTLLGSREDGTTQG